MDPTSARNWHQYGAALLAAVLQQRVESGLVPAASAFDAPIRVLKASVALYNSSSSDAGDAKKTETKSEAKASCSSAVACDAAMLALCDCLCRRNNESGEDLLEVTRLLDSLVAKQAPAARVQRARLALSQGDRKAALQSLLAGGGAANEAVAVELAALHMLDSAYGAGEAALTAALVAEEKKTEKKNHVAIVRLQCRLGRHYYFSKKYKAGMDVMAAATKSRFGAQSPTALLLYALFQMKKRKWKRAQSLLVRAATHCRNDVHIDADGTASSSAQRKRRFLYATSDVRLLLLMLQAQVSFRLKRFVVARTALDAALAASGGDANGDGGLGCIHFQLARLHFTDAKNGKALAADVLNSTQRKGAVASLERAVRAAPSCALYTETLADMKN
jgi:hypothetical protein